jgi:hypothetical protein
MHRLGTHHSLWPALWPALLVALVCLGAQAQTAQILKSDGRGPVEERQTSASSDRDELADLRADIRKMQSLVNEMQANFALVGNPTTPLNHELQLTIDLWRVVIAETERRVQRLEKQNSSRSRQP